MLTGAWLAAGVNEVAEVAGGAGGAEVAGATGLLTAEEPGAGEQTEALSTSSSTSCTALAAPSSHTKHAYSARSSIQIQKCTSVSFLKMVTVMVLNMVLKLGYI